MPRAPTRVLAWLLVLAAAAAAAAQQAAAVADAQASYERGSEYRGYERNSREEEESYGDDDYGAREECKPNGALCSRSLECCDESDCVAHTCWSDAYEAPLAAGTWTSALPPRTAVVPSSAGACTATTTQCAAIHPITAAGLPRLRPGAVLSFQATAPPDGTCTQAITNAVLQSVLAYLQTQGVTNARVTVVCTSTDGPTFISTAREVSPGAQHVLMQVDVLQADGTILKIDTTIWYPGTRTAADNLVTTAEKNLTDVGNLTGNLAAASNGSVVAVQNSTTGSVSSETVDTSVSNPRLTLQRSGEEPSLPTNTSFFLSSTYTDGVTPLVGKNITGPTVAPPGSVTCEPPGGAVTNANGIAGWTCTTSATPPNDTFTLTVLVPSTGATASLTSTIILGPGGCATGPSLANTDWPGCGVPAVSGAECQGNCSATTAPNPGTSVPNATCSAGSFVVDGNCNACNVQPTAVAGVDVFTCALPVASGTNCTAACNTTQGYSGSAVYTCTAGVYSIQEQCTATPSVNCTTAPSLANTDWPGCGVPAVSGAECQGNCSATTAPNPGTSAPNATCSAGSFVVDGNCNACNVQPTAVAGVDVFTCALPVASGTNCTAACNTTQGYSGSAVYTCTAGVYSIQEQCTATPSVNCTTAPSLANTDWPGCGVPAVSGAECQGNCSATTAPNPGTSAPNATCSAGSFVVDGNCNACNVQPTAVAGVDAFTCALPVASGTNCTAACNTTQGYSGSAVYTCTAGVYSIQEQCNPPSGGCAACPSLTNTQWTGCSVPAATGDVCQGTCSTGFVPSTGSSEPNATCTNPSWSYAGNCDSPCVALGDNCTLSSECCGHAASPSSYYCDDGGKCAFTNICMEANTMVHVREASKPVALKDVATGQHVLCTDTADDLPTPTSVAWCKVHNWAEAKDITHEQARIEFTRPSGEKGQLTLEFAHPVVKLVGAMEGQVALRMDEFGATDVVRSELLAPGDLVAVLTLTDPRNAASGFFTAVAVTDVTRVPAEAMLTPAIEKPFIIAGDMVASASVGGLPPTQLNSDTVDASHHALQHMLLATIYTQQFQPVGTTGAAAIASNKPMMTERGMLPEAQAIVDAIIKRSRTGAALNADAVREWWHAQFAAVKAGARTATAKAGPTVEDTLALIAADSTWA